MLVVKISLVVALGVVFVTGLKEQEKIVEGCLKENGLDQNSFEDLKNGNFKDSSDREKNYMHCLFVKLNFIDENNKVNLDNLASVFPDNKQAEIKDVAEKCLESSDDHTLPDIEAIWEFVECTKEPYQQIMKEENNS